MKVITSFIFLCVLYSINSLRLTSISDSLTSDVPEIPSIELDSSLHPLNLRLTQVRTSYTNQPLAPNRSSGGNSNVAAANSKGSILNLLSSIGLIMLSLIFL
jgi:hypothetical protein